MNLIPDDMIPIDELIEIWIKAHKEVHAMFAQVQDSDLSWWREALKHLRPDWDPPEDNKILDDQDENR